ncbi:hypothetical protein ABEB36_015509 [Hypothenemus hampei]|uniref:SWIM-type domain-containing protein n=1 Tax=Hypothenemus hampei TaxID=57062 RepID=A0ABD1DZX9_HYPHA
MEKKYEKYSNLPITELKNILRRRGGALKGKKKDLIERLIFYDKNNNFTIKPALLIDDPHLQNTLFTPSADKYKDMNSNCNLPSLKKLNIFNYLERFDVTSEKGRKMYENKFLLNVRVAMNGNTYFFKGKCKASMKKSISYIIDIQISASGTIEASQCDCGVGEQPTAHCKHVVAVLFAIEQMKWEKKIILNVTCTQELQSFHKPDKQYFGTPLKTSNLPGNQLNESVNFQPVDPAMLNPEKYRERVRNQCISFVAYSSSTMPFKYTIMPANIYAAVADHDYAAVDLAEEVLKSLKVANLNDKDIEEIEKSTRDQADSTQWQERRRHHLTASNFYNCCKAISSTAKINLVERIIHPTPFKSKQTQHGRDCEAKAISIFEHFTATPDGLIGDETLIEVKCPWNQRKDLVNEKNYSLPDV